ncbi:MAG: hypothetical protein KIT84_28955 [Labilithrix sp.]|nr:hypothetical protein [Labilithrix sp.]
MAMNVDDELIVRWDPGETKRAWKILAPLVTPERAALVLRTPRAVR